MWRWKAGVDKLKCNSLDLKLPTFQQKNFKLINIPIMLVGTQILSQFAPLVRFDETPQWSNGRHRSHNSKV